jgi:hypothetical protein
VYTHARGTVITGMSTKGERIAAADDPHPGIPAAMYGFQWKALGFDRASAISVKYAVGGSLRSGF